MSNVSGRHSRIVCADDSFGRAVVAVPRKISAAQPGRAQPPGGSQPGSTSGCLASERGAGNLPDGTSKSDAGNRPAPAQASPEAAARSEAEKTAESDQATAQETPPEAHCRSACNHFAPRRKNRTEWRHGRPAVQLAPGVSDEQASSQRQSTTQLLATTDTNLKQISARQLNASQQDSVSQIRKYMEQAKAAEKSRETCSARRIWRPRPCCCRMIW